MVLSRTEGKPAASAAGFTTADFKGRYVGHFSGTDWGIISIDADGAGGGTLFFEFSGANGAEGWQGSLATQFPPGAPNGYVVVQSVGSTPTVTVVGFLSDRGKTLDFRIINGTGTPAAAGVVTIQ